ncbi:hypothetical protein EVAR_71070_1, partial [Eumeta japonica]
MGIRKPKPEKFYLPGENLTIDEQFVPFRGRVSFKQYLPSKPDKYGTNRIPNGKSGLVEREVADGKRRELLERGFGMREEGNGPPCTPRNKHYVNLEKLMYEYVDQRASDANADERIFDILPEMYPNSTRELEVSGGKLIKFSANSLSAMMDLRKLQASNTQNLIFESHTAYEMNVLNLRLWETIASGGEIEIKSPRKIGIKRIGIDYRNEIKIEDETGFETDRPVTVMISNCDEVKIEREAFSWIINFTILNIEIRNSVVPVLPKQVFGSSSGQIRLENTRVHTAKAEAFSATYYNKIIVNASSVGLIEQEAFSQKSLIITLEFVNCNILEMQQKAILSAANNFIMRNSSASDGTSSTKPRQPNVEVLKSMFLSLKKKEYRDTGSSLSSKKLTYNVFYSFNVIQTGSVNATVAFVKIEYSTFYKVYARGFVLTSWNRIAMKNNTFLKMEPHAFVSNPGHVHDFSFVNNIIDASDNGAFGLIGQAHSRAPNDVDYRNNYFNKECNCLIEDWLSSELGITEKAFDQFALNSYCTIEEIAIARCFNVPDKNLEISKFLAKVCNDNDNIKCEPFKTKLEDGSLPNFENPFFHDEEQDTNVLSDRNKKIIGIVIVTI